MSSPSTSPSHAPRIPEIKIKSSLARCNTQSTNYPTLLKPPHSPETTRSYESNTTHPRKRPPFQHPNHQALTSLPSLDSALSSPLLSSPQSPPNQSMASPAPTPTSPRTTHLRTRAHAFCTAFTSATPPTAMLDTFFTPSPTIFEHGPAWAQSRLPFLGKTFVGRRHPDKINTHPTTTSSTSKLEPESQSQRKDEEDNDNTSCDAYFALLAQTLTFHPTDDTFPPAEDIVVDAEAEGGTGVVSVVGRAEFRSVRTGRGWVEEFVWRLGGWDREGRVGRWEIWADPLSAWVAVGGEGEGEGERGLWVRGA